MHTASKTTSGQASIPIQVKGGGPTKMTARIGSDRNHIKNFSMNPKNEKLASFSLQTLAKFVYISKRSLF
jgi:hypothetical protein